MNRCAADRTRSPAYGDRLLHLNRMQRAEDLVVAGPHEAVAEPGTVRRVRRREAIRAVGERHVVLDAAVAEAPRERRTLRDREVALAEAEAPDSDRCRAAQLNRRARWSRDGARPAVWSD